MKRITFETVNLRQVLAVGTTTRHFGVDGGRAIYDGGTGTLRFASEGVTVLVDGDSVTYLAYDSE